MVLPAPSPEGRGDRVHNKDRFKYDMGDLVDAQQIDHKLGRAI